MATKSEIATKVLQKLTVLEADETKDTDDDTLVQGIYDSVYHILAAEDLVSWGSGDDVPSNAVLPVVGLVARECIEEFTVPAQVAQGLILNEQRYKGMLSMLEHDDYVPEEDEAEYF